MAKEAGLVLTVKSILQEKGLVDAKLRIDELEKQVQKVTAKLDEAKNSGDGFTKTLGGMGYSVEGLAGKFAGLFAASQVFSFLKKETLDAIGFERQMRGVQATLEAIGPAAQGQLPAIRDFLGQLTAISGVGDEELLPHFQNLLGLTQDVGASMEGMRVAMALSKMTGKDLSAVTEALGAILAGRAAQGAKALGINIKALGGEGAPTAEAMKLLLARVDNFEQASGGAVSGITRVKAAMEDFGGYVGAGLAPAWQAAASGLGWLVEQVTIGVKQLTTHVAMGFGWIAKESRVLWSYVTGAGPEARARIEQEWGDTLALLEEDYRAASEGVKAIDEDRAKNRAALLKATGAQDQAGLADMARRSIQIEKALLDARAALAGEHSRGRLRAELAALAEERRAKLAQEKLTAEDRARIEETYRLKEQAARLKFEREAAEAADQNETALLRAKLAREKQGSEEAFRLELAILEREKAAAIRKAEERGDATATVAARFDEQIAAAREKHERALADRAYEIQKKALEGRLALAEKGSDAEYELRAELLRLEYDHTVDAHEYTTDELYLVWQDFWNRLDALTREHTDKQQQQILDSAQKLAQAEGDDPDVKNDPKRRYDAQLKEKDAAWRKEREKYKGNKDALANIDKAHERDLANLDKQFKAENKARQKEAFATSFAMMRQAFGNNKAFAIAEAIVSTYRAAAQALTVMPPWLGIALAAIDVAAGLAYVAKIQGTDSTRGAGFDDPVNDAYAREMGGRRWARDLVNQIGAGFRSELAAVSPFPVGPAGGTAVQQISTAGDTYNFHGAVIDDTSLRHFMRRARRAERRDGARYAR